MATEQPGDGQGLMFSAAPPRKRKLPLTGIVLGAVAVAIVGGGGFVLMNQEALREAQASVWILPNGVASMGEAYRCLADHNLPCAEADMIAYLKKYPNDGRATALLAITLTRDGHHKEAVYFYHRARALGVANYDFHADFARSLEVVGDVDGAIREGQAALELNPRLVDVRGNLADDLVKKGRGKEALDLLKGFDRQLEAEGYPPYFPDQIQRIEVSLGGDYAKASADTAVPSGAPGESRIRGVPMAGTLVVPVSIDGAAASPFVVDSGASLVSLPSADAQPLQARGLIRPSDFRGTRIIRLANGTLVPAKVYSLQSVKVGDREVKDVLVAVYAGRGPRLLGQSFLKRFKSWSVDNDRRMLVLTD